ncbi:hypothetical protein FKF97_09615 [Clostridium perfringens]|uniref:hypothetical protein n=1 Tax=Clostridium perfringens TaxID=1502 RepID=UPI000F53A680|nr:hypothetical protein [Clostridium perfringens]EGT3606650.1 hypothetical protein [Clostridium perfringens]
MNEIIVSSIKQVIPIIVGALIAIVPNIVEKYYERKKQKEQSEYQRKQETYIELISLFDKILSNQRNGFDMESEVDKLRNIINMISITGSKEVVKALNDYIKTWGYSNVDIQTKYYTDLLKTIRVDLSIDKKIDVDFPEIGLIDINFKK